MREIKFRAWDGDEMLYLKSTGIQKFDFENGYVLSFSDEGYKEFYAHECYPSTKCDYPVMQFTGLKDKNGKDIYEGDILKYFILKNYVQQSHPDISPEIDEYYVKEQINTVVFKDGAFQCDNAEYDFFIQLLSELGLSDINNIKEHCGCMDDETADCNGNEIDESILGIEIIGNIYENPELNKPTT